MDDGDAAGTFRPVEPAVARRPPSGRPWPPRPIGPTAPIDVARARADTPGCADVAHLNHAGCSLAPRPVLDAQIEWLRPRR